MASHFLLLSGVLTHGAAQDQSYGQHGAGIARKKRPPIPRRDFGVPSRSNRRDVDRPEQHLRAIGLSGAVFSETE